MRRLVVDTTEGLQLEFELAGAGSRALAALVDVVLAGTVVLALLLVAALFAQFDPTGLSRLVLGALAGGWLLLLALYHALVPRFLDGRTPGKAMLGLRVLDAQGAPAAPLQHALRSLFWPLELLVAIPVPLGLVLIALSGRHQRLGDFVAGTVVVHDPIGDLAGSPPSPRPPAPGTPGPPADPVAAALGLGPSAAARLGAADRRFLRRLVSRRGLTQAARGRLFVSAARHYAERLELTLPSPLDPATARRALLALHRFAAPD